MPERGNENAEKATKQKAGTNEGSPAEGKSPESGPLGGDGDPGPAPMGGGEAEPNPSAESKVKSGDEGGEAGEDRG